MSFLPVKLGPAFVPIVQPHHRDPLYLSPSARTIRFPQPFDIANVALNGNVFDLFDRPDDLKAVHCRMMPIWIKKFK